jgi:hypothetical protein
MISSPCPSRPEKTQIAVDGADQRHRDFRFENTLTDQHGDDVRLKKSAYVEVTFTEDPESLINAIGEDIRLNRISPEKRHRKLAEAT